MIREDRELLTELARLNTDMPSLGLRVMEGSAITLSDSLPQVNGYSAEWTTWAARLSRARL